MTRARVRGLRWWMIGLIMLGSVINYLTRSTLAVAAPTLLEELHITTQQYSWILSTFQVAIMFQPIAGYVLDSIGLKLGYAIFVISWSLISIMHGLATTWPVLAALRGMLGFAEGSSGPAGMKATADWFPARERGIAGGIFNLGASTGSLLAAPLVAWAILTHSWQFAFVITGCLGLVWALAWLWLYSSPEESLRLTDSERAHILAGQEQHLRSDGSRPSVRSLLGQRNFWGIGLPRLLADPTWGTLTFWIPLYLTKVRHFDLKQIALFAWLPFLAADFGSMFGGLVVLQLQRRGIALLTARRVAFTLGAVLMLGMGFVGFAESPYVAIALLSLGGFAHQTLSVTVITMSSDLFRKNEVATVAGMAGTLGNAGVLISGLLIGGLVTTVGYKPVFIALPVLDVIGAIIVWTVIRDQSNMHTAPT